MKNIEKTIQIAALFHEYYQQSLNTADEQRLSEWLDAKPENRARFEKILSELQQNNGQRETKYDHRVETALRRVKINLNKPSKPLYRRYLPYAAAVILLFLSIIVYQAYYGKIEVLTASAETKELHLADGTYIILEPCSKLTYTKAFGRSDRKVKLEGEAYFKVAKDEQHPFTVLGRSVKVDVLGTSFRMKNYLTDEKTCVLVTSGKVRVADLQRPEMTTVLRYGDEAVYLKNKPLKTQKHDKREVDKIGAGIEVYEGEQIQNVIKDLERSYGVSIDCPDELKRRLFFGDLNAKEKLPFFLDKLTMTVHAKWKQISSNQYRIQHE